MSSPGKSPVKCFASYRRAAPIYYRRHARLRYLLLTLALLLGSDLSAHADFAGNIKLHPPCPDVVNTYSDTEPASRLAALNVMLESAPQTEPAGRQADFYGRHARHDPEGSGEIRFFGECPRARTGAGRSPFDQMDGKLYRQSAAEISAGIPGGYRLSGVDARYEQTDLRELKVVSDVETAPATIRPETGPASRIPASETTPSQTGSGNTPDHGSPEVQAGPVATDHPSHKRDAFAPDTGATGLATDLAGVEADHRPHDVGVTKADWFVVGQADLTLGRKSTSGLTGRMAGESPAEGHYAAGRLAIYAKGETDSGVKITASIDTGEERLQDVFTNLDRKDPAQLLRRTDTSQQYPVYGDDSTLTEDAPTQGRVYLRAEKNESQLVLGNFIAQATGTELAQLDRGLFGAMVNLRTDARMDFGEYQGQLFAFASEPGTVPAREEFRGTGGSLYLLKRQDVSVGSERVRVEVRERTSGIVLESHDLHPFIDYDFDPFQGRLLLLRPLSSVVRPDTAVRDGTAGGNIPVLVVRYEYTPASMSLQGRTIGARGVRWIGQHLRLGATYQDDASGDADQLLMASDLFVRAAEGTYLKAEIARSTGAGFGEANSVDGGLSFFDFASPGQRQDSYAWRAELALDIGELNGRQADLGTLSAYLETLEQGFSSAGRLTGSDTSVWGARLALPIGPATRLAARADALETAGAGANRSVSLDLEKQIDLGEAAVTARTGLSYDDRSPGLLFNSTRQGQRVDLAADIAYRPPRQTWDLSLFGQVTIDREKSRPRNNRAGAGISAALSDRLRLETEVSGGDGGPGIDLTLNRRLSDGSESYIGYIAHADGASTDEDPTRLRSQTGTASLIAGSRHHISDQVSVFGENRFGIGGTAPSASRIYSISYEPDDHISVTASLERGQIDDAQTGLLQRTAASIAVGLAGHAYRVMSAIEMRRETGAGGEQEVWLLRNSASFEASTDWRYLGEFNIARADTDGPSIRAAEFTEANIGLSYRPVDHDRFNGLVRLHYFEDLGPLGQLTGAGRTESPKQVSGILSADGNYDLTQRLSIGIKYGYRQGKVSLGRSSDEFVSSDAHLGILRADYNIMKSWDIVAEGRVLTVPGADEEKFGILTAAYRHLNETIKLGFGYSWADFSDDLTDQSYSSGGAFLNLLAAF